MSHYDNRPQGLPIHDGCPPGGVPREILSPTVLLVILIGVGFPALVGLSIFAFG